MSVKKKLISILTIGLLAAGVFIFEAVQPTMATPDRGSDCTKCHSAMPPSKANVKVTQPAPAANLTAPTTTAKPAAGTTTSNYTGKNVTVTATALNVRASGSTTAKIVDVVKKNTVLSVLKQSSGWLQVKYQGKAGWVYAKYVTLAATQPTAPTTPAATTTKPTTTTPPVVIVVPTPPAVSVTPARPTLVTVPSINDSYKNSKYGSMHWNFFGEEVINGGSHYSDSCIGCHSAVKIVDDPNAKITDFLKKGQQYAIETVKDAAGKDVVQYKTATEDGKYISNNLEGITCRVCHIMDKNGITLRRPDNTCTLCHGLTFDLTKGTGHHIEQDFFVGHGETTYSPSLHYTLGMQCQDCHTMNALKHDFTVVPDDIVRNAKCQACHQDAKQLQGIIDKTQKTVTDSLKKINDRLAALADSKDPLVAKAKNRVTFITADYSNGVHNPQFAGKLINEANNYLDQVTKPSTSTAKVDLGNLMVYSQAQSSELGSAHWTFFSVEAITGGSHYSDSCIGCHSAKTIVDDPKAKITDFLKKDQQYAVETVKDSTGKDVVQFKTAAEDGKYISNNLEGITCRVCHTFDQQPGYISLRRSKEQTCGLCHGRPFDWNTGTSHHIELSFLKGQGSAEKGIPDMPSFKVGMGFACQDCHFMDSTKHDFQPATPAQIVANKKCNTCHTSASSLTSTIDGIQADVTAKIAKLQPRLDAAKAYVDKNPTNAVAKETYTQAQSGVNFIVSDYSNGVHNPDFAKYLLDRSDKLLTDFESKYNYQNKL